jgi:hypothetical protein
VDPPPCWLGVELGELMLCTLGFFCIQPGWVAPMRSEKIIYQESTERNSPHSASILRSGLQKCGVRRCLQQHPSLPTCLPRYSPVWTLCVCVCVCVCMCVTEGGERGRERDSSPCSLSLESGNFSLPLLIQHPSFSELHTTVSYCSL